MLENGFPDYRIQKWNEWSKRYKDMYYCDNGMQMDTAMEDFEYTKWLDPDPEVGAYRKYNWLWMSTFMMMRSLTICIKKF